MDEFALLKKPWLELAGIGGFFFILFLILFCSTSSGGSEEAVITAFLVPPFTDNVNFTITSEFGDRVDPIDNETITFHTGIDLSAPEGTDIVSSGVGKVINVGYQENGLGNYVVIEHDLGGLMLYTVYGHMLDNSIVVKTNTIVKTRDKIGVIGTTGKSTGIHLHFMIMKYKYSYSKEYLVNPINVISGIKEDTNY